MKKSLLILVALMMVSLISCSKEKDSSKEAGGSEKAKTSEVDGKKDSDSEAAEGEAAAAVSKADEASQFVLERTSLVEVFSINQRMHEDYKEIGPLWVVRGIDSKGRTTEVWVNEGKIYDIE